MCTYIKKCDHEDRTRGRIITLFSVKNTERIQECKEVYEAISRLKMWHIAARQYAATVGIKHALYVSFDCRKFIKNNAL
jgi:hypothetical protein